MQEGEEAMETLSAGDGDVGRILEFPLTPVSIGYVPRSDYVTAGFDISASPRERLCPKSAL